MNERRLQELALRRELLMLRIGLQRESLRARWQTTTAPLEHIGTAVSGARAWLGPVTALAGMPLLWTLLRRRRSWIRMARWVLPAWQLLRLARRRKRV